MKKEFVQPRFAGARFNQNTLPLDVARDLIAYEELVIELAKRLYLREHPGRKRVPKGFEAGFHLHLERLDDGSVRPMLALVTMTAVGMLPLASSGSPYFEKARDEITEVIAAPPNALPTTFPKDLLAHFDNVGRSLQDGEVMEFPRKGGGQAELTPARRRHLVLAAKNRYEENVELVGAVEEVDLKKERRSFRLRLTSGSALDIPLPAAFERKATDCLGKDRVQVTINGTGEYDVKGSLQRVLKAHSFETQPDYQIASQLDEIGALSDGWHDKTGVAFDQAKLASVFEGLVGQYPENLPLPIIVPTPEGNLLFEWRTPGDPSLDIYLETLTADFHAFGEDDEDVEASFDLQASGGWGRLFELLDRQLTRGLA